MFIETNHITDQEKRVLMEGLVGFLVNSASMLTIDDIHYLTVQVRLAWQHPVELLSLLQQPCGQNPALTDE